MKFHSRRKSLNIEPLPNLHRFREKIISILRMFESHRHSKTEYLWNSIFVYFTIWKVFISCWFIFFSVHESSFFIDSKQQHSQSGYSIWYKVDANWLMKLAEPSKTVPGVKKWYSGRHIKLHVINVLIKLFSKVSGP